MTNAAAPLCVQKLGRILDELKVIDDPPDAHFWQLATAARVGAAPDVSRGCNRAPRKARAFCQKLAGLVKKLIRAADHTKAVDDAIVTTINRASGAKRAGNQQALRLQLTHASKLERDLRTALASEASVGRQIRKLLPFGKLTKAQAAKATSYLERHGVTVARLRRIDPAALHPSGLDPIARLVNP